MNDTYGEITVKDVLGWVASGAMVLGGVVPYIPQYSEIKQTEDTDGFSLYVCLALLVANTLRILFWFGKHFELPLLFQSILMNIMMLLMIKLCVSTKNRSQIIKSREHIFTDFRSYLQFLVLFAAVGGVLMYFLVDVAIFVELIGLLAVLTEAMLGVPQFIRNFFKKSTSGMSISMVTMWMVGDTFKTCYFIQREAPIQFSICGVIQVLIDFCILAQVYIYKNHPGVVRQVTRTD